MQKIMMYADLHYRNDYVFCAYNVQQRLDNAIKLTGLLLKKLPPGVVKIMHTYTNIWSGMLLINKQRLGIVGLHCYAF